eukprot:UN06906
MARSSLISYLSITKNQDVPKTEHSMITEVLKMCTPYFINCSLGVQDVLGTDERMKKFVEVIRNEEAREYVRKQLWEQKDKHVDSLSRWQIVCESLNRFVIEKKGENKYVDEKEIRWIKKELILHHTYPRLDVEVTRHLNHLLKSPFCVHPKTGKLCVPIDINNLDNFSPINTPTLRTLHTELETALKERKQQKTEEKVDWTKIPTMQNCIKLWRECFLDGLRNDNAVKMEV